MRVGGVGRTVVALGAGGESVAVCLHVRYALGRTASDRLWPGAWQLWAGVVLVYGLILAWCALKVVLTGRGATALLVGEVFLALASLDMSAANLWFGPVIGGLVAAVTLAVIAYLSPRLLRWMIPLQVIVVAGELALVLIL